MDAILAALEAETFGHSETCKSPHFEDNGRQSKDTMS